MIKLENLRILVIDDDNVMTTLVVNFLQKLGVREIKTANNGKSGLLLVGGFKPDLILSDIHMEPMDGVEFTKKLRTYPVQTLRKTPVLLMSADSSSDTLKQSISSGISGYIVKPPTMSTLKTKIELAMR